MQQKPKAGDFTPEDLLDFVTMWDTMRYLVRKLRILCQIRFGLGACSFRARCTSINSLVDGHKYIGTAGRTPVLADRRT
jgi:hypothetical protein